MLIQAFASSSSGNSYHVSDGQTSLLLEAGLPYRQIQKHMDFQLSSVAGCLITHSHADHSKAAADLMKAAVETYMSEGTAIGIGISRREEAPSGHQILVTNYSIFHRLHIIEPKQMFTVGTFSVLPFETEHDCPGSLGFLLISNVTGERLLFATDTYFLRYRFKGLNFIMVECNYAKDILDANTEAGRLPESLRNRLIKSHFSLEHVKGFLKANDLSGVREIWLLHLSDGNSDAARFKREIQELTGIPVRIADKG